MTRTTRRFFLSSVLLLGLVNRPSLAADAARPHDATKPKAHVEKPYWRQNLFVRIWKDQKPMFVQWWPAEFRRPEFSAPLGEALVLAATSTDGKNGGIDVWWANGFSSQCTGSCQHVAEAFTKLGDTSVAVVALGAGWLIARWSHHDRFAEATSLAAEALIDTSIYNEGLKILTARARPPGGSQGAFFNYGGPPPGQELGSFPSGHAQGAFTAAAVFSGVYDDHPSVRWTTYTIAGLIAASRVALHRHFPSDVMVGGLLGDSIGRFVVRRSREQAPSHTLSSALIHLHPIADPENHFYGFAWDGTW